LVHSETRVTRKSERGSALVRPDVAIMRAMKKILLFTMVLLITGSAFAQPHHRHHRHHHHHSHTR
jgi:hypothetical protein